MGFNKFKASVLTHTPKLSLIWVGVVSCLLPVAWRMRILGIATALEQYLAKIAIACLTALLGGSSAPAKMAFAISSRLIKIAMPSGSKAVIAANAFSWGSNRSISIAPISSGYMETFI